MAAIYLHPDDYPWTNTLLSVMVSAGTGLRREVPGYQPEPEGGATVDWDMMQGSFLSSTENGVVSIARGLATIERAGGFPRQETDNPGAVGSVVLAAIQSIALGDVDIEAFLADQDQP
jgi:hypothetical protein